jgi:tRNA 2-selenouridine synthase
LKTAPLDSADPTNPPAPSDQYKGQRHLPKKVSLESRDRYDEIIDVRSPSEFERDHVEGAINCPVLSDAEHAKVGTLYHHVSPFEARRVGAALTARNIATHLETTFKDKPKQWKPLIYCRRGGQRSESMGIVLRQVGWRADRLEGGYKSWRRHVLDALEVEPKQFHYRVVSGLTGCGKTRLLHALADEGAQVLDLEGLVSHKGSVLGGDPEQKQPSQQKFESALYRLFTQFEPSRPIYIEAESRRIASIHLPQALFESFSNSSDLIDLRASCALRIALLEEEYLWASEESAWIKSQLTRIEKLHPKERMARWVAWIDEGDLHSLIRELLQYHYDPLYEKSHHYQFKHYALAHPIELKSLSHESFKQLAQQILSNER